MSFDRQFEERFMISGPPIDTFVDTDYEMRISPGMPNFPPDLIPRDYPEYTQHRKFQMPELAYIAKSQMPPDLIIAEANEEAYQARLASYRARLVNKAMAAPITPPNLIDMRMDLDDLPDNNPQYGEIPTIHLPVGYEEALKSALRFPKDKVPPSLYEISPSSSRSSASPVTPSSEKKKVRFNMPAPPPSPASASSSPSRIPVPVSRVRKDSTKTRETRKVRAETSSPYRRTSEGSSRGTERASSSSTRKSTRKSL